MHNLIIKCIIIQDFFEVSISNANKQIINFLLIAKSVNGIRFANWI